MTLGINFLEESAQPTVSSPPREGALSATVRSHILDWWNVGLRATAQSIIDATSMLKTGLLVCNHNFFFLPASLDFLSRSIFLLSLKKYQAGRIAFLTILREQFPFNYFKCQVWPTSLFKQHTCSASKIIPQGPHSDRSPQLSQKY